MFVFTIVLKKETVPSDSMKFGKDASAPLSSNDIVDYSVAVILESVKNNDRFEADSKDPTEFKPKSVNPALLNPDGTPKVFYHGAKLGGRD